MDIWCNKPVRNSVSFGAYNSSVSGSLLPSLSHTPLLEIESLKRYNRLVVRQRIIPRTTAGRLIHANVIQKNSLSGVF